MTSAAFRGPPPPHSSARGIAALPYLGMPSRACHRKRCISAHVGCNTGLEYPPSSFSVLASVLFAWLNGQGLLAALAGSRPWQCIRLALILHGLRCSARYDCFSHESNGCCSRSSRRSRRSASTSAAPWPHAPTRKQQKRKQ